MNLNNLLNLNIFTVKNSWNGNQYIFINLLLGIILKFS